MLDIIDQHIDLRKRVRRLETEVQGTPSLYAERVAHPHPIAEHLCKASTVQSYPFGQVAGQYWAREQHEQDVEIHRLLRVARERVGANDWIGNRGFVEMSRQDAQTMIPIQPRGAWISHGKAPQNKSKYVYFKNGYSANRVVLPGKLKFRRHFYLGAAGITDDTKYFRGWQDEGMGRGLAAQNESGSQEMPNHLHPWPKETLLDNEPMPEDMFVLGMNVAFSPKKFNFGRGTAEYWGQNPDGSFSVKEVFPETRLEIALPDGAGDYGPHVGLVRSSSMNRAVNSNPYYHDAGVYSYPAAHVKDSNGQTLYYEEVISINTTYVCINTDWIRSWGPATEEPTTDGWFGRRLEGGVVLSHSKPFTQATFDDVVNRYSAVIADLGLTGWYSETARPITHRISSIPYDHKWVEVTRGPAALPATGKLEANLRHGVVSLRGWLRGNGQNTELATLAQEYRPAHRIDFAVPTSAGTLVTVRIDPTGVINGSATQHHWFDGTHPFPVI